MTQRSGEMISLWIYSQIKGTPVRSAIAKCILSQIWGQAMMLSIHVLTVYQVSLQMRAAIPVVSAQEGWVELLDPLGLAETKAMCWSSSWRGKCLALIRCLLSTQQNLISPSCPQATGLSHACLALKRENKQGTFKMQVLLRPISP